MFPPRAPFFSLVWGNLPVPPCPLARHESRSRLVTPELAIEIVEALDKGERRVASKQDGAWSTAAGVDAKWRGERIELSSELLASSGDIPK